MNENLENVTHKITQLASPADTSPEVVRVEGGSPERTTERSRSRSRREKRHRSRSRRRSRSSRRRKHHRRSNSRSEHRRKRSTSRDIDVRRSEHREGTSISRDDRRERKSGSRVEKSDTRSDSRDEKRDRTSISRRDSRDGIRRERSDSIESDHRGRRDSRDVTKHSRDGARRERRDSREGGRRNSRDVRRHSRDGVRRERRDSREGDRRGRRDSRDVRYESKSRKNTRSPPRYSREQVPKSPTRDRFTWRRTSPAPHLSAEERDFRTVFVMQLSQKCQPREIAEFFSKAGKVHDVRIVNDRITSRSKGVAYVEFVDINSVSQALGLTGHRMNGQPIVVEETMSEKNRIVKDEHTVQEGPAEETKVYASSIHHSISEAELKSIFEAYGSVEFVDLHKDPGTGLSKGFAYIQYYNSNDAKEAIDRLNGFQISGKALRVGIVTDKTVPVYGAIHDNDEDGIALSGTSRHDLMAKLAASRSVDIPVTRPSKCILIKNAFDPAMETEPDWETDIQEDFSSECQKFGKVVHCFVDPKTKGYIYLKFNDIDSSKKAISVLDKRFFAGRQLSVGYVTESVYHTKFPKSASL